MFCRRSLKGFLEFDYCAYIFRIRHYEFIKYGQKNDQNYYYKSYYRHLIQRKFIPRLFKFRQSVLVRQFGGVDRGNVYFSLIVIHFFSSPFYFSWSLTRGSKALITKSASRLNIITMIPSTITTAETANTSLLSMAVSP